MRPIRLRLNNFKAHKDSTVEFEDGMLYYLIGVVDNNRRRSNNAGKSSVVHAINFALWRQIEESSDSNLEDLIHTGCDKAVVCFEFHTPNGQVMAERTVKRTKKAASSSLRVFLMEDGEYVEHESREQTDRQAFLENLLGFDKYVWWRTAMKTQGVDPQFFSVTPERRVEMLSKIMGLQGTLDRALEITKSKLKDVMDQKVDQDAELKVYRRDLLSDVQIEDMDNQYDDMGLEIDKLSDQLTEAEKYEGFQAEVDRLKDTQDEYLHQRDKVMAKAMEGLTTAKQDADKRLMEMESDRHKRLKDMERHFDSVGRELNRIQREMNRYRQSCEIEILEPKEHEDDLVDEIESLESEREKAEQYGRSISENLAVLTSEISRLQSAEDSVCPILNEKCDRVSKDAVGKLICGAEDQIKEEQADQDDFQSAFNDLKQKIRDAKERLKETRKAHSEREDYLASVREYEQFVERHQDDLEELNRELDSLSEQRDSLKHPSQSETDLKAEIEDLREQIRNFQETDEAKEWIRKSKDLQPQIDKLEDKLSYAPPSKKEIRSKIQHLQDERAGINADIKRHDESLRKIKSLEKEIKPLNDSYDRLMNVKHTFGKQGFLSSHLSAMLPALEAKINEYLNFFDAGRLSVSMEEPISIYDAVSQTYFKPSSLSYGQRSVIAFCYGMALIWLRFKSSPQMQMICMDEPFEHVDEDYLDSSMSVVLHLYRELGLKSCILISHKHFDNRPENMRVLEMRNNGGVCRLTAV